MGALLGSLACGFEWILGLGSVIWSGPVPRLRLDILGRLLLLPPGDGGELQAHEDEDEETRKSGCDDVGHGTA